MANRVKGNRTQKAKNAEQSQHELLESPEALRSTLITSTEDFFSKKKNQRIFLGIALAVALIVAGIFGYQYYMSNQNEIAQEEMFQAVFYFEADSLNKALNGDGNNYGFLEIIDEFGGTKAANLAHFYAGISYLKQGEHENAIEHLQEFSASDYILQARAYALIGDAYMEMEQYDQAAQHYEKAADHNPNRFFTPGYLEKAAMAYEAKGDYKTAAELYNRIIEEFPASTAYQEALKQKARLEGLASGN